MNKVQKITTWVLAFTVFLFFLKTFGFIKTDGDLILSYAFIFSGISSVYVSFGQNLKWVLLAGTVFFCLGLLMFIVNKFYFPSPVKLIIPATVMTFSLSAFMLFLDDSANKAFLYLSLTLLFLTIIIAKIWGGISFVVFFSSAWSTLISYWPVVLILFLVLFLLREKDF